MTASEEARILGSVVIIWPTSSPALTCCKRSKFNWVTAPDFGLVTYAVMGSTWPTRTGGATYFRHIAISVATPPAKTIKGIARTRNARHRCAGAVGITGNG